MSLDTEGGVAISTCFQLHCFSVAIDPFKLSYTATDEQVKIVTMRVQPQQPSLSGVHPKLFSHRPPLDNHRVRLAVLGPMPGQPSKLAVVRIVGQALGDGIEVVLENASRKLVDRNGPGGPGGSPDSFSGPIQATPVRLLADGILQVGEIVLKQLVKAGQAKVLPDEAAFVADLKVLADLRTEGQHWDICYGPEKRERDHLL